MCGATDYGKKDRSDDVDFISEFLTTSTTGDVFLVVCLRSTFSVRGKYQPSLFTNFSVAMAGLRHVRDCLLLSHAQNLITDEEFVFLYDVNTSKNPDFPYWSYPRFELENWTDDECKAEFRFFLNDIFFLQEVLHIPDEITCPN